MSLLKKSPAILPSRQSISDFEYLLFRSPRLRRLTVQVNPQGEVIVRSPLRLPADTIERFLEKHSPWVRRKLLAARRNPPPRFAAGEEFYYLGVPYPLIFGDSGSHSIKFSGAFIVAEELSAKAEELLTGWLWRQALKHIQERTGELAARHSLRYRQLSLNNAGTNWGSCSSRGHLRFNWRLIQCPPEIIDYIIIHELAHLVEMNHSPHYWALVETMYPNYEACKNWLKRNSSRLRLL
jgi:hypothetical protein